MKKFFSLLIAFTLISTASFAQVPFRTDNPDLEMVAKRIFYDNGILTLTGTITWHGSSDYNNFNFFGTHIRVIDDEGEVYSYKNTQFQVGDKIVQRRISGYGAEVNLPSDIPLRFELTIYDVNSYATEIVYFELPYGGSPDNQKIRFKGSLRFVNQE